MQSSAGMRLALLLIGALLIRAGWGLRQPAGYDAIRALPDQREYLELGRNLRTQGVLVFHDDRFDDDVFAYRMPGYPLLIAACGENVSAVRLIQAIIDTSTVLAVYLLARRWLSAGGSFFAALFVALNPFLIYFSALILSESLFVSMLAWSLVLLISRHVAIGAALLALSVLVRPSAIALPAIMGFAATVAHTNWRRALGVGVLCALLTVVALLPWGIRNKRVLGERIWTTSNGGITAYDGLNPSANGSSNQTFVRNMPELHSMGEVARSDHLAKLALEYARANPVRAIELGARKIARTWSPIPLSDQFGSRALYVILAAIYSIPFDLLVIFGLWRGQLSPGTKVLLVLPAVYFTVVHAVSVGSLRYRMPAEAPMAIVAAAGAEMLAKQKRPHKIQ